MIIGKTLREFNKERSIINTNILVLDNILGGGIISRSIAVITGAPGVGKTQLLLKITDNAYKQGYEIIYLDTELSIVESRLKYFNEDLANYIYPINLSFEELDKILTDLNSNLIKQKKPVLLIIDSISAITSNKRLDTPLDKDTAYALDPRFIKDLMKKLLRMTATYNLTVVVTTHLTMNIQGPMISTAYSLTYKGYRIPGGQAIQFSAGQLIILTPKGKKELKNMQLQYIEAYTMKNRLAPSGLSSILVYSPEFGYSNLLTNIKYLEDNNLVKISQGRYQFPFRDKSMLLKDIIQAYKEDKNFAKELDDFIAKSIQNKIEEIQSKFIKEDEALDDIVDLNDEDIDLKEFEATEEELKDL